MDSADFVLSRFSKSELAVIAPTIMAAADAVELWSRSGIAESMNRVNGPTPKSSSDDSDGPEGDAKSSARP
jgi:peptidyl-tRNA hydrolase